MSFLLSILFCVFNSQAATTAELEVFYTNLEGRWVGEYTEYTYVRLKDGYWNEILQPVGKDPGTGSFWVTKKDEYQTFLLIENNLLSMATVRVSDGQRVVNIPYNVTELSPTHMVIRTELSASEGYSETTTDITLGVKFSRQAIDYELQPDGTYLVTEYPRKEYFLTPTAP